MRETMARIRAGVAPYLKRRELIYISCVFLSSLLFACAVKGNGIAPLAVSVVAGVWIYGDSPVFALLGAVIGAVISGDYASACAALAFVASVLLLFAWRGGVSRANKLVMLTVSQLVMLPLFYHSGLNAFMTGLANLSLSLLGAVIISRALEGVNDIKKARIVDHSAQMSLMVLGGIFVYAASFISVSGINFGAACAAFFAMAAAKAKGAVSLTAAVVFGIGYVLGGEGDMLFVGSLALCTLTASLIKGSGKWGVPTAFMTVAAFASLLVSHTPVYLFEASIGAFMFACLPKKALHRLEIYAGRKESIAAQAALYETQTRLREAAKVIAGVAQLFSKTELEEARLANRQILAASSLMLRLAEGRNKKPRRYYDVSVGATACPKAGNEETGDSMSMREADGRVLLLLSDGMGSGAMAHKESATTVALLGDLLSVGFELNEALDCVNRLMIIRDQSDMYATLDALLLDLSNAEAKFIKHGAPPSYVIRGDRVYTLYAEALPVGIVHEARPALHSVNLHRGDTVVMMTDGVYDALGEELLDALLDCAGPEENPDKAANALLLAAREKNDLDDMSVMVAKIS